MLSFHQSRGRILFEAFCSFAISASFLGAWTDLGTLAFLPGAAVFALHGLVRLFDLRGRQPAAVAGVADVAVAEEIQGDLLAFAQPAQSEPVVQVWPVTETEDRVEDSGPVPETPEPVAKKPARARRKKAVAAMPAIAGPPQVALADPVPETTSIDFDEDEQAAIE